jgi:hypothetical protein
MLAFERANVRRCDEVDSVALPAGNFGVFCHKGEAGLSVLEAGRVEFYDRNLAASVFRVAAAAGFLGDGRVVASSLIQAVA